MRAVALTLALLLLPASALAERWCGPGMRYRGKLIDVDVKEAELHNVFRFLADVGKANIVIADDVKGAVTIRVKRVPWDQVMCTIARLKKLELSNDRGILYVTPEPVRQ